MRHLYTIIIIKNSTRLLSNKLLSNNRFKSLFDYLDKVLSQVLNDNGKIYC